MAATYDENTVLWRLRSADGVRARLTFIPGRPASTLAWFLGDALDRVENYDTWDAAMKRAEETRLTLLAEGWTEED